MREKPYKYTEREIAVAATVFNIPKCLVEKIVNLTYLHHSIFLLKPLEVNFSHREYEYMLRGASIAYKNQTLIGKELPRNHPKSIAINKMLVDMGVSIQYHPHTGMVIVENDEN